MNKTSEYRLSIDNTGIVFDSVASDNFVTTPALAGASILDEKMSVQFFCREHCEKMVAEKNQHDKSFVVVYLDKCQRLSFCFHLNLTDERAVISGKTLPEYSVAQWCERLMANNKIDWRKLLLPDNRPFGMFHLSYSGNKPISLPYTNNLFSVVTNEADFQKLLLNWHKSGFPHRFSLYESDLNDSSVGRGRRKRANVAESNTETLRGKLILKKSVDSFPPKMKSSSTLFSMTFDYVDENGFGVMRMYKLIMINPYGPPTKVYLPLTNWGEDLLHPETGTLLKLPLPGKQPLYNLRDIHAATSVVLCASLDDAEALKKANAHQTAVAFTSFVCDPGCYDEVDVEPLNGKKLYMLISNQSGRTIAEEYLTANEVYAHLRSELDEKATFAFIHREVRYPDVGIAKSVDDVLTAYKTSPPVVRSFESVSESEFKRRVGGISAFLLNQSWIVPEPDSDEDSVEHDRTMQMLLRPFLHRGNITTIYGPAKTGKTTISMGFSALIVSGKPGKTFIKGAAITVPKGAKPGKVVYLAFDSNCASNTVKLKADAKVTYGLDDTELANLIMIPMVGRGADFKTNYHAIADEVRAAADKHGTKGRKLSLIVVDTLSPLGEPVSAMRTVEAFSAEFPQAGILCLSHDNTEGGPNGGGKHGGKIFGACTHVVKLENVDDGVHFFFETSNDGVLPFDKEGFTYKIVDKHGKIEIVNPVRSEDDARASVKQQLMDDGESAEECSRQLGLSPSALRAAVQRSTTEAEGSKDVE